MAFVVLEGNSMWNKRGNASNQILTEFETQSPPGIPPGFMKISETQYSQKIVSE